MIAQDLLELLRQRPFRPLRLVTADGAVYTVRHPDEALVLRTRVILPLPNPYGVAEGAVHLALGQVTRFEELPAEVE